jgi:hypothetical protein
MRIVCVWAIAITCAGAAWAQTASPGAGVPLEVATTRAALISDLRYNLALTIPRALADPITGTNRITFDLRSNTAPLVIDFETSRDHITSLQANGMAAAFEYVNGMSSCPPRR